MAFTLSQAVFMQVSTIICPGPVEETIKNWAQYNSQLSGPQQSSVDSLADLIVSSFNQSSCPPFREVKIVGHADKDWHGAAFEDKVSFDRAMTVQKALTAAVLKLWSDRNMGPPPPGGVNWDVSGKGSKQMIAPQYHAANRRVVVTLLRSGGIIPVPAENFLISPKGTPLHPKATGKMINIFGEKETEPGFVNYSTSAQWAMGRPITNDPNRPPGLDDKSASDICLRSSPLSKLTLDEMERIAMPGARFTIALNSDPKTDGHPGSTDEQLKRFRDHFPKRITLFDGVHHGTNEFTNTPSDWKVIVIEVP